MTTVAHRTAPSAPERAPEPPVTSGGGRGLQLRRAHERRADAVADRVVQEPAGDLLDPTTKSIASIASSRTIIWGSYPDF